MRKHLLFIVLLAAAVVAGAAVAAQWVLQSAAARLAPWLREGGLAAEVHAELVPWPRLVVANARASLGEAAAPLALEFPAAVVDVDLAGSLRRLTPCLRVEVVRPRLTLSGPIAGLDASGGDPLLAVLPLTAPYLGPRGASELPLPCLSSVQVRDLAVFLSLPVGEPLRVFALYSAAAELGAPQFVRLRAAGERGFPAQRFDLEALGSSEESGGERWRVRGTVLVGDDTALEFSPLEVVWGGDASVQAASGEGRVAGGLWQLELPPPPAGGESAVRRISLRLERALLKPLVNDFFAEYRNLVSGQVTLRLDADLPAAAFTRDGAGAIRPEQLALRAEFAARDLTVAQTNFLYGLMLTAFQKVRPEAKALPDELRGAFPDLLVKARTQFAELSGLLEVAGGQLRIDGLRGRGAGFSVQASGAWDPQDRSVDSRWILELEPRLATALCTVVPALAACVTMADPHAPLPLAFSWRGTLGEEWPRPTLAENGDW
jgi:hypothetical protein